MLVKRESLVDAETLHNDAAGAVGEAPLLVAIVFEDSPRGMEILNRHPVNGRDHSGNKLARQGPAPPIFATLLEEGQELIDYVVGGDQWNLIRAQPF